ncbi:hypothetical protein FBU30_008685 [Linnemannia zychae]|nr:hypothetical protein FBU30_008685 [Linnemannia zychae]
MIRSGTQCESIPSGYQRPPSHQGFQEHGRAATFPHPRPQSFHHQSGNIQSFTRVTESQGSTHGQRHATFSEPSTAGASAPRSSSGYSHLYRGQTSDLYHDSHTTSPQVQTSPQRQNPFHSDPSEPLGASDIQLGRKRPSNSLPHHAAPVYPPSAGGPERTSGGYPISHPAVAQEPAPVPPSHRGSTGNMIMPSNTAAPRQRQNSLPHVLDSHPYQHQPQHQQQPHHPSQHSHQLHQHQIQQQYPNPHNNSGHHSYATHAQLSPKSRGAGGPTSPTSIPLGAHRTPQMYQGGYESHHHHHSASTHEHEGPHARLHPHMEENISSYPHSITDERRHVRPSSLQPRRPSQQYQSIPVHGVSHQSKIPSLLNSEDAQRVNNGDSKGIVSPRAGSGPGSGPGSGSRALSLGNIHPINMPSMASGSSWTLSGQQALGASPGQALSAPLPSPGIGGTGGGSVGYMIAGGVKASSNTSRGEGATGSRTQFHAPLEPEVVAKLDELFFKFLQRICSDLNVCDSKGDPIHQPLMAKKMQRLEASTDFRPFKFRIQAFTNAFHESLVREGLTEDILPLRKVKVYLWKHRYISRFNEDGKKQKSKGNHVWNIEARKRPDSSLSAAGNASGTIVTSTTGHSSAGSPEIKTVDGAEVTSTPQGKWEFREYSSRIAGQIIKFARVGVPYIYAPRIWDAQMSCPKAEYTSPWLPGWLKWHKGELRGIPGPDDKSCTITVIAEYMREGEKCRLEMEFPLTVSDPQKEGDLMDEDTQGREETYQEQEEEEDEDEEQGGEDEAEDEEVDDDEEEEAGEDDEDCVEGADGQKEGKQGALHKVSPERRSKRRRQT